MRIQYPHETHFDRHRQQWAVRELHISNFSETWHSVLILISQNVNFTVPSLRSCYIAKRSCYNFKWGEAGIAELSTDFNISTKIMYIHLFASGEAESLGFRLHNRWCTRPDPRLQHPHADIPKIAARVQQRFFPIFAHHHVNHMQ